MPREIINDDATLASLVDSLESRVTTLEGKMDDLYMRPRMPYAQGASSGDLLELDGSLIPQWVSP